MGERITYSHVPKLPILTTQPWTATFSFSNYKMLPHAVPKQWRLSARQRLSELSKPLGREDQISRWKKKQHHLGNPYWKHGVLHMRCLHLRILHAVIATSNSFTDAKNTKYRLVNSLTPLFLSLTAVALPPHKFACQFRYSYPLQDTKCELFCGAMWQRGGRLWRRNRRPNTGQQDNTATWRAVLNLLVTEDTRWTF
jgi:hypothetical protein